MDPWTIVGALGVAVAALGGFIGKLYADNRRLQRALEESQERRLSRAESYEKMLQAMVDEFKEEKKGGRP